MNAPTPAAATAPADAMLVARAPLGHFAPSLTNRKHTAAHITELAQSIKVDDIAQPITARPWPAARSKPPKGVLYEIVIGEGRWLGSGEAGKEDIPFFWRDLTDEQALRLQLIENLKRKDLTEIEEAEGYRRLMKDHGYTADRVADDIGKSRSHIYGRLKLLDLSPGALAVVQEHKVEATVAVLVARIPDPKLQEQAAKEIARGRWNSGEPMSYRAAAEHVQQNFMLKLAEAPFSRADTDLVPGAGRCHDCPKRTGNARELFDDVKSADVCTDPSCYHSKAAAHTKRQQELAKAEGRKIIKGKEAEKLKPHNYGSIQGGYVDLDKTVHVDGKSKTVRQILGAEAPKADLLVDPHRKDTLIEVLPLATIRDQLQAKGALSQVTGREQKSDKEKADQKAAKLREKIDTTFSQRLFDQIRSRLIQEIDDGDAPYLEIEEERLVAHHFFDLTSYGLQGKVARVWLSPKDDKASDYQLTEELKERIGTMDRKEIAKLMLDLTLISEAGEARAPKRMLEIAKNMNVDADALKVEIRKELTPKDKAKPAAKKEAKVQPNTALSATGALQIGDRVRVKSGTHTNREGVVKAPKEGTPPGYLVTLGLPPAAAWPFPTTNEPVFFLADELEKIPAAAPSTPSKAAQAREGTATNPAALAVKAKADAKKPKTKNNPAPATPANEAATPPKTDTPTEAKATNGDLFPNAPEFPQPNEHGVYPDDKAEAFEWKAGKHLVTIKVLQVAEGWIPNLSAKYKDGTFSGGIMARDGVHPRREDAIAGGAKDARHMLLAPKGDYGYTTTQKKSLGEWLDKLEATGKEGK